MTKLKTTITNGSAWTSKCSLCEHPLDESHDFAMHDMIGDEKIVIMWRWYKNQWKTDLIHIVMSVILIILICTQ